jgi:meso-butanediol dehydrogenase/(S,S)-butanediol dehydrogenase/diacetyl reductase
MNIKERVYIITGAARGIGLAVAKVLLEEGSSVVMVDMDAETLQAATVEADQSGQRAVARTADVTNPADASAAVAVALERFGRLDGLVNNAGIVKMDSAWDLTAESWNQHMSVNVTGSFLFAKAVGEHLKASGGGAIVNVASNAGKVGYANMAPYNSSKAAVIGLTRSLSMEWAEHNINVNAVCPGGVETPMLREVADWLSPRIDVPADDLFDGMTAGQLGRRIQPREVGRVIAFLLSDDATIIRGQSISIDGGDTPY